MSNRKPKVNTVNTNDLTEAEWKELEFTGVVIKGNRIIRTLSHVKTLQKGAREEINRTARRLFAKTERRAS